MLDTEIKNTTITEGLFEILRKVAEEKKESTIKIDQLQDHELNRIFSIKHCRPDSILLSKLYEYSNSLSDAIKTENIQPKLESEMIKTAQKIINDLLISFNQDLEEGKFWQSQGLPLELQKKYQRKLESSFLFFIIPAICRKNTSDNPDIPNQIFFKNSDKIILDFLNQISKINGNHAFLDEEILTKIYIDKFLTENLLSFFLEYHSKKILNDTTIQQMRKGISYEILLNSNMADNIIENIRKFIETIFIKNTFLKFEKNPNSYIKYTLIKSTLILFENFDTLEEKEICLKKIAHYMDTALLKDIISAFLEKINDEKNSPQRNINLTQTYQILLTYLPKSSKHLKTNNEIANKNNRTLRSISFDKFAFLKGKFTEEKDRTMSLALPYDKNTENNSWVPGIIPPNK